MGLMLIIEIGIPILLIVGVILIFFKFKDWFCRQPLLKTLCGKLASKPCGKINAGNPSDSPEGTACSFPSYGHTCYLHTVKDTDGTMKWQCTSDNCANHGYCQRGYSPTATHCASGQDRGVSSLDAIGKACYWDGHNAKRCYLHVRKANDGVNRWIDETGEKDCCNCDGCVWDDVNKKCNPDGMNGPVVNHIKPGPAKECGSGRNRGVLADEEPEGQACSWSGHGGHVCYLHAQSNTWDGKRRWVCDDNCKTHKGCCSCPGCKWDSANGVCLTDGTHQEDLRS